MFACILACLYVRLYVLNKVSMYITYVYNIYIYIYIYTHAIAYVCIYIYIYIDLLNGAHLRPLLIVLWFGGLGFRVSCSGFRVQGYSSVLRLA